MSTAPLSVPQYVRDIVGREAESYVSPQSPLTPHSSPLTPLAHSPSHPQHLSAYLQHVRNSASSEAASYVYNTHAVPAEAWAAELASELGRARAEAHEVQLQVWGGGMGGGRRDRPRHAVSSLQVRP